MYSANIKVFLLFQNKNGMFLCGKYYFKQVHFQYTEEKVIKGAVFNIYGDIDCDYIFEHFICPGITP